MHGWEQISQKAFNFVVFVGHLPHLHVFSKTSSSALLNHVVAQSQLTQLTTSWIILWETCSISGAFDLLYLLGWFYLLVIYCKVTWNFLCEMPPTFISPFFSRLHPRFRRVLNGSWLRPIFDCSLCFLLLIKTAMFKTTWGLFLLITKSFTVFDTSTSARYFTFPVHLNSNTFIPSRSVGFAMHVYLIKIDILFPKRDSPAFIVAKFSYVLMWFEVLYRWLR